ncbi:BAG family molecular chaperone regulator 8 [Cardamine amara subsp. amara]|uniref:BAG family molecular chaperone regulator 8 n=1 Tax=Cardamine amara subsp. amara TaxID=228776 RepID=A0ABD0ZIK2_CARAN
MASRHHQHNHNHNCSCHQNHHHNIPQFATSPYCCPQSNHPSPPPEANLLHLLASYLQNQQQETQCSCETQFQSFNGIRRQQKKVPRPQQEYDNHIVLSCLLRKINDLESSLNKFSASYDQHSTLRDSAARIIQTHFRSYLVHRSVSFRQLKELATIKSSFLSLKSSILEKPHFPFKAVSRKASDLLLQLDSIQGRIDPMIRSSKRSLSRDLVRFLQYIDDCAVKRYDFVGKVNGKKPQGLGVAEDRTIEKLRKRMGRVFSGDEDNNGDMTDDSEEVPMNGIDNRKIGSSKCRTGGFVKGNLVKPPVRKSKNRNVYQVYGNTHDLTLSAEEDSVDSDEEMLVISRDNGRKHSLKARNLVLVKGSGGKTTRVSVDENGNVYKVNGDRNDQTSSEDDDDLVDTDEEILVISKGNGRKHSLKARNEVLVKGSGGKTNRVVKTVRFDENGNVYKVYGDKPESSVGEEDDSTSGSNDANGEEKEVEEIKYVPKKSDGFEGEEEEETHSEDEVSSSEGSEGNVIVTRDVNHPECKEHKKEGGLMFSPPLPLKMEP